MRLLKDGINTGFTVPQPKHFEFESSGLWKDSGDFTRDEFSKIYMCNKLIRINKRLAQYEHETLPKHKNIEAAKSMYNAYGTSPLYKGDPDEIKESLRDMMHELRLTEYFKVKLQTQIAKIKDLVGGEYICFF